MVALFVLLHSRIVCARAYNDPAPSEDTVFDHAHLVPDGTSWISLVYTHRKQTAAVYLNGVAVQTLQAFTYPREGMFGGHQGSSGAMVLTHPCSASTPGSHHHSVS